MRVLVACEFSGIVRDAFITRGHDAVSCDLLDTEIPGPHIKGNVLDYLFKEWDLLIAHPPCTFIANSGVRHLHTQAGRWDKLARARLFFLALLDSGINMVCVENPIPHKYARLPKYTQIIHPWQFGHGETKATCLWLSGLPKLEPTNIVEGRKPRVHHEPPSDERWKNRSRTLTGIAEAMAAQWG